MSIVREFKEFAVKGNAIDLAVGIIIGGAFGKIVTSLVSDIILPPIGLLIGGVNFKDIKMVLKKATLDGNGLVTAPEVTLNVGNFIQSVFDFIIIAIVIFMMINGINKLKNQEVVAPPAPPEPSNEEKLLSEIRDLLKSRPT